MQKKAILLITILLFLLLLTPAVALADETSVSSNDLIDHARDYDGTSIVYTGEVVGDILYRGDHAWLAVSDGSNTIGVYVSAEQAETISSVGGYGKRGDTIRVEGVFHRACAEHGGDMDIHAESLRILAVGGVVQTSLSRLVRVLAMLLPLPAAALLFLVWKRRAVSQNKRNLLTNPAKK